MNVISVVLILCVFAVVFYLIWKYVPTVAKPILLVVVGVALVLWFLQLIGVLGAITGARVG